MQLGQVVELDDTTLFIAEFTGLKTAGGLRFSFNPCRRWEYINYSGGNDHLFTVYYVVNEQVREIAESVAFRLVAASGCSTYPLVFNKVTFSKKRLSKSSHGRAQDSNAKKPKRSDSIETVNETALVDKNHERVLYSMKIVFFPEPYILLTTKMTCSLCVAIVCSG